MSLSVLQLLSTPLLDKHRKNILQDAREGFDQLIATGQGALETKYVIAQLCILFCVGEFSRKTSLWELTLHWFPA